MVEHTEMTEGNLILVSVIKLQTTMEENGLT